MSESTYNDIFYQRGEYAVTDQIERVVLERLPEGTPNDNPEHYTEEDGCFQPCPGSDPENVSGVYRRIPDPVPALQARIAELLEHWPGEWIYEDALPEMTKEQFDRAYEFSKVNGVRIYPAIPGITVEPLE